MDVAGYQRQVDRLHEVRRSRDNRAVRARLADLAAAARREDANLMALLLDAVREYATLQEMMDVLRARVGRLRGAGDSLVAAFLSFHAPGFWLVVSLLCMLAAAAAQPFLPRPWRGVAMLAAWLVVPYLALISGGVSPRLLGAALPGLGDDLSAGRGHSAGGGRAGRGRAAGSR
jgi:hypothetical protein